MFNQQLLFYSANGQIVRMPNETNRHVAHRQEPVAIFVPNLFPLPQPYLHRLIAYINIRRQLSSWVASMISGAISGR